MREMIFYLYLNFVCKESNKMNDLVLDRVYDVQFMIGINNKMQKIAIQSQLIGLKTLLKITNTVSK
jgi:hypothetical protein